MVERCILDIISIYKYYKFFFIFLLVLEGIFLNGRSEKINIISILFYILILIVLKILI